MRIHRKTTGYGMWSDGALKQYPLKLFKARENTTYLNPYAAGG